MNLTLWLALLALAAVALWQLLAPGLDRQIARALREGQVEPLLAAIARLSPQAQPDAFHRAIRRLWDAYQRPLAATLIRALAERHHGQRIAQYWLEQLRGVEPALAQQQLGDAFYDSYFQPHVAATCGKAG